MYGKIIILGKIVWPLFHLHECTPDLSIINGRPLNCIMYIICIIMFYGSKYSRNLVVHYEFSYYDLINLKSILNCSLCFFLCNQLRHMYLQWPVWRPFHVFILHSAPFEVSFAVWGGLLSKVASFTASSRSREFVYSSGFLISQLYIFEQTDLIHFTNENWKIANFKFDRNKFRKKRLVLKIQDEAFDGRRFFPLCVKHWSTSW